jgi:hypothetical protein
MPENESNTAALPVDVPRLVSPWEDISSHSKNSKDRTPRTWRRKIGVFTIRLIHYPPDVWLATCDGVFPQQPMKSPDVREAACQAVAKLQFAIDDARNEILGANYLEQEHNEL